MTWLTTFIYEFWNTTALMAPWLLFGFAVAGLLSLVFSPEYVRRHLGGRGWLGVVKAAAFGVPLPLCSCGVVPVTLGLRRQGAGKGEAAAFMLSTPQTGVDSFMVTWSMLGWVFAVVRVITALVTGVIGGLAVKWFDPEPAAQEGATDAATPEITGNRFIYALRYAFITLFDSIALSLLIGLLIAALIGVLVPPGMLGGYRGSELVTMLLMLVIGIPLYVCSTGSVPIAAALVLKGVSPGAALVFLIAGPATNAAAIAAMWQMFGRRTTVIYLATLAVMALLAGMVMNMFTVSIVADVKESCHQEIALWQQVAGGLLLLMLAVSLTRRMIAGRMFRRAVVEGRSRLELRIKGINCAHCRQTATAALLGVTGVTAAEVGLDGRAQVEYRAAPPERAALAAALDKAGFTLL